MHVCFTISTLILFIYCTVTVIVLNCCFATNRHEFNSGLLITIFYSLAGIIAVDTLQLLHPFGCTDRAVLCKGLRRAAKIYLQSSNSVQTFMSSGIIINENMVVVVHGIIKIIMITLDSDTAILSLYYAVTAPPQTLLVLNVQQ